MTTKLAPTLKLSNGQEIPNIGLGTWRSYDSDVTQAVKDAIDVGYRHIDTAFVYENEQNIGAAIRAKVDEGVIKRDQLFIVSKLGGIHHDPELVEHACLKSLTDLGLDYIDLYLIHFPVGQVYTDDKNVHGTLNLSDVDYVDTWKAMEFLVDKGLVRGIGLSNFNAEQTDRVLQNCRIKPLVNQVECHPGLNQKRLINFSRERGIAIIAYSPLAQPDPAQKWPPFIFDLTSKQLAQKYNKTSAQICLRYLIQLGVIPIPKSVKRNRIVENFNVFDFELSADDMNAIDGYNTGRRLVTFGGMKRHKYYPFKNDF